MLKKILLGILLYTCVTMLNAEDQPLDLDFTNAPVTSIIQTIAQLAGKNVVISAHVAGSMSLHVNHMNWPQALNLVLENQNLKLKNINNTWYIGPTAELINQEKSNPIALSTQTQTESVVPLQTDFIQIHYANVKALQDLILQDRALLSAEGQIVTDRRTGTLVVTDTPAHLKMVAAVIAHLDIPVQQVHIEARIVIVDKSALQSLGIVLDNSATSAMNVLGSVSNATINLPILNPAATIGFGLGKIAGSQLNLELQALEASGDGKVISAPELTVSNNQEAYIEQGSEIPFQTSTSSGATQIEFKKAVLGLRVIPQLTENGKINLILQVNKDSISHQTGAAGDMPIINTSQVNTNVLVSSGETIVLGGIYGEEKIHALNEVPVLGGIPGIGWLFRSTNNSEKYTDLLIFVTPTVVTAQNEIGRGSML
jgi:type IV pilus assembly protein PilQ